MAAPIKKAGFGAFERPKTKPIKILRRLWKYLIEFKWLLIAALTLSLLSNFFSLIGPMLSGKAIDAIEPGAGKVDFKKEGKRSRKHAKTRYRGDRFK
jgi:hypothetical protein